jgi:hypothetical protein
MENQLPEADKESSALSFLKFFGWIFVTAGPWICVYVLFNWVWVPGYFQWIVISTLCLLVIFVVVLIRLFMGWKPVEAGGRAFRITMIVVHSLIYAVFLLRLVVGQVAYNANGGEFTYQLPQGEYTFYVQEYTSTGLTHCCRVWVHQEGSAFVYPAADAVSRFDILEEPTVENGIVRFYFTDRRLFDAEDQYLEFDAVTNQGTWFSGSSPASFLR